MMTHKIDTGQPGNKPQGNGSFLGVLLQVFILIIFVPLGYVFRQIWFSLLGIPVVLLMNYMRALQKKNIPGMIVFSLTTCMSLGLIVYFTPQDALQKKQQVGLAIAFFSISWFMIWYGYKRIQGKFWWWSFLPGTIFFSLASCVGVSGGSVFDYIFYIGGGIGIGLLIWGLAERLLGLIIAGSVTMTTAPGISFAFYYYQIPNILSQIGNLLIWFGVGWGLITISTRVVYEKFVWWPLIPAGVLVGVGLGLYFGGIPGIGFDLLSNTGIFSVVILAGYIILYRLRF